MSDNKLHQTMSALLTDRLTRNKGKSLNKETCLEIYQDIFYSLTEVFKESNTPLGNESANLLAQMYYDCVTLETTSGPMGLDPNIFDKRASTDNIPTKELALMATMMRGTPFMPVFVGAIKRRS